MPKVGQYLVSRGQEPVELRSFKNVRKQSSSNSFYNIDILLTRASAGAVPTDPSELDSLFAPFLASPPACCLLAEGNLAQYLNGFGRVVEYQWITDTAREVTRIWEGDINQGTMAMTGFGREVLKNSLVVGYWDRDLLSGRAIQYRDGRLASQGLFVRANKGGSALVSHTVSDLRSRT